MRGFFVALLAGLLFACPLLCGADAIGHSARHEAGSEDAGDDHSPSQCPEGADNCVCRGARAAGDARTVAPEAVSADPHHFLIVLPRLVTTTRHPLFDGSPIGPAGRGDALTVRAHLQNFRF